MTTVEVFRSTRLRQCSGTEEPLNRTTHQSGGHLRGDRSGESPSWRVAEFASLAWGLSVLSLLAPYLALNFFRAFHTDYGGNIQASHRPERLGLGIFPSSQRLTNRVMPFYKPES